MDTSPTDYPCRYCGEKQVVYFDEGNWRKFVCEGCYSKAPLSAADLIIATKDKPSKSYAKLRRDGVIGRGQRNTSGRSK